MRLGTKFWTYAVLGTALAACQARSGGPSDLNGDGIQDTLDAGVRGVDNVTQMAPASPVATLFGTLLNAYDGTPLANVEVQVTSSKNHLLKATTDANGGFMINAVSPGDYRLVAQSEGFMTLRVVGFAHVEEGITDNNNILLGRVYMFPSVSKYTVALITTDGRPLANATAVVNVTTGAIDWRTSLDQAASDEIEAEYTTITATANAEGIIEVPGVPNAARLTHLVASEDVYLLEVITAPFDIDADGLVDYAGTVWGFDVRDLASTANTAVVQPEPYTGNGGDFTCTSNLIEQDSDFYSVNLLPAGSPIIFVCNEPVDPASVSVSIINSFADKNASLANSRSLVPGERAAVDAINANTKPLTGTPSMSVTTSVARNVVYLTPSQALPAGADIRIRGTLASAWRGTSPGTSRVFELGNALGAYISPSDPAVSISSVYVERNAGGTGYNAITLVLSRAIRAYEGNGGMLFVCINEDLNGNGRRTNAATGGLEPGECPADVDTAPYSFNAVDGPNVIQAVLRPGTDPLLPATGQFFTIYEGDDNTDGIFNPVTGSRSSLAIRVIVPILNNQVVSAPNQLSLPDGTPIGYGVLAKADITIGTGIVISDLPATLNVFAP